MLVNVSIVCYGTADWELRRCLGSLSGGSVHCVYVVDNSRSEGTRRVVEEYAGVVYIGSENRGYGAGHNVAMARSLDDGVDLHLVLNSDVYFEPGVLDRLVAVMAGRGEIGLLQPRVLYADGRMQYTVRRLPRPWDVFGRRFMPGWIMRGGDARYLLKDVDHSEEIHGGYLQGSFMLLRVETLRVVGVFDERFFMYPEDIDMSRRVGEVADVVYYPGESVVHDHRQGSYHSWRLLWVHVVNMVRYFNKWGWIWDRKRRMVNRGMTKGGKRLMGGDLEK